MNSAIQSCPLCDFARWGDLSLRVSIGIAIDEVKVIDFLTAPRAYQVLSSVRASSASGCLGCRVLGAACDFALRHRPSVTVMSFYCNSRDSFIKGSWDDWSESADVRRQEFDVFTPPGSPTVPRIAVMPEVPRNTYPSHSAPQIQEWLSKCASTHNLCERSKSYLPPRVLDLRTVHVSQVIRLIDSSILGISRAVRVAQDLPPRVKYACLSHCWGGTTSVRLTTKHTIAANRKGIPISELPLTFRDAVEIYRALDIDYIWIDSLCIIQGDADDWKDHVNLMTEIYQNAYLTFGAGASRNSEGGLFRDATLATDKDESVLISSQLVNYELHFRKRFVHWFEPDAYSKTERGWPLLGRGWVFQEYLLSPRFVAFGQEEIAWACYESRSCSCGPTTSIQKPIECRTDQQEFDPLYNEFKARVAGIKDTNSTDVESLWSDVVNVYSQMKLTKPTDKLPAIAGIARFFESLEKGYLGGIWQQNLHRGLLWKVSREHTDALPVLPEKGRARSLPSWTWASATDEGRIQYSSTIDGIPQSMPLFEIVQVNVDQSRGKFIDLASGSLTIRGTLLPMSIRIVPDIEASEPVELVESWRESVDRVSHREWNIAPWDRMLDLDFRPGRDLAAANERLASVMLLLTRPECEASHAVVVAGLVLIRVGKFDASRQRRPQYERLGSLQYTVLADPAENDEGEIESYFAGDSAGIDAAPVLAEWGGTRVAATVFDFV